MRPIQGDPLSYFKETPCGQCKKAIRYSDSQLGTTVRCPKCGNNVTLGLPAVPGAQNPQANIDKSNRPVGAPVSAKGKPGWVKDVKDLAGVVPPTPTGRTEVFETAKPVGKVSNDAWADRNATGVPPLPSSPPPGNYTLVRRVAMGLSAAAMIGLLATGTWWFRTSAAGTGQMQTQSGPAKTVGGDAQQPPAGGAQPQAPTTPQTPPPSTPSTPPGQPEPPPTPPQDQNALDPKRPHAEQVHVVTDFESVLFASSIIGMRDFDKSYYESLTSEDSFARMIKVSEEEIEWCDSLTAFRFEYQHKTVFGQRPTLVLSVPLEHLPNGVQLAVYADVVEPQGQAITGLVKPRHLVSKTNSVPLDLDSPSELKSAVDFNKEKNCFEVNLNLPWIHEELRRLKQEVSFELALTVVYADGSEDKVKDRITVKPVRELEKYPLRAEYGTLIDKEHPWVKRIINELNQSSEVKSQGISIDGASGKVEDIVPAVFFLWKNLKSRGIRYQNMAKGELSFDSQEKLYQSQQMRPVHQAMNDQNANCADGTILFASFFEAMGLKTSLVFVHGHVFVAFKAYVPDEKTEKAPSVKREILFPIETTTIGERVEQHPPFEISEDDSVYERNAKILSSDLERRLPFVKKDPAFWNFASALIGGGRAVDEQLEKLRQIEALAKSAKDPEEERIKLIHDNEAELFIVDVTAWRMLGVRAIGAPSDLNTYTLPAVKR